MIIYLNGNKYDITEFINEHPGGSDLFIDGKDMTKEFEEAQHSDIAKKMLKKYLIKSEEKEEKKEENEEEKDLLEDKGLIEILLLKFRKKKFSRLFTKEDSANIHKILGVYALLNYAYFFFDLYYSGCKGEITLRKKNVNLLFSIIPLIILSLSGLMFHTPIKINNITVSMPREYQYHSVIFALRSLFIVIVLILFGKNIYTKLMIILIIFLTMKLADITSAKFKHKDDILGSKVGSVAFWSDCPVYIEKIIKKIYVFAQLGFTSYIILEGGIEINIAAAFVIQVTAFLFTLMKKGIITLKLWHILYLILYLIAIIGSLRTYALPVALSCASLIYILRVKASINKYTIWSVFSIISMFFMQGKKDSVTIIKYIFLLIIIFFIFYSKDMIFDKKRLKSKNEIIKNKSINNHHIITTKLVKNTEFNPGQYFNIYVDGLKRPYTPISIKGKNMTFFIKNYKNRKISEKICSLPENKEMIITGPFGKKYYDKEKDVIMINGKKIETQNILFFSCGTGITPFYSIITNLNENTKYKTKMFCSFRSKKDIFLANKIKSKLFLSEKNKKLNPKRVKKILKKYDPKNTTIFVCGTESYQEMIISRTEKYKIIKW